MQTQSVPANPTEWTSNLALPIALILCIFTAFYRLKIDDGFEVLKIALIALFLHGSMRTWNAEGFILRTLIFTILGFWFSFAWWAIGCVGVYWFLRGRLWRAYSWQALGFSALLAGWLIGIYWGRGGHHHPLWEATVGSGRVNLDSLFHAAIAQAIRFFHHPSTLLHGLVPVNGYIGSHFLIAGISSGSSLSVFETYQMAFLPLFAPALAQCIFNWGTYCLRQMSVASSSIGGFAALGLIGPWKDEWMDAQGIWRSDFISESHVVSMILAFAFLERLIASKSQERRYVLPWLLFLAVCLVLTKVSTAAILGTALFALWVSDKRFRNFKIGTLTTCLALGTIWMALNLNASSGEGGLDLFHFVGKYTRSPSLFFIYFALLSIGAIGALGRIRFFEKKTSIFLILFTVILSLAPALLLHIEDGSAFYFFAVPLAFLVPMNIAYVAKASEVLPQNLVYYFVIFLFVWKAGDFGRRGFKESTRRVELLKTVEPAVPRLQHFNRLARTSDERRPNTLVDPGTEAATLSPGLNDFARFFLAPALTGYATVANFPSKAEKLRSYGMAFYRPYLQDLLAWRSSSPSLDLKKVPGDFKHIISLDSL